MDDTPSPELIDYLQQAIDCCRSNASFPDLPPFAAGQLRDVSDNVDFFLRQREYARAFHEARLATRINSAVARYIQASAEAVTQLREEIGGS